jgi:hypothetical protein
MLENSIPGEKCVRNQSLVDKDIVILSLLHILLGLMGNSFIAMNKQGKSFERKLSESQ